MKTEFIYIGRDESIEDKAVDGIVNLDDNKDVTLNKKPLIVVSSYFDIDNETMNIYIDNK